MRGVTYTIRSSLYVAVTNRCCTTSLVASRGPGLSMPPSFHPLPAGIEPSAADVLREVTGRLGDGGGSGDDGGINSGPFDEVVFAGVGEPLLRWSVVKEAAFSLRSLRAEKLTRPRPSSKTNSAPEAAPGEGLRRAAQQESSSINVADVSTSSARTATASARRATTLPLSEEEVVIPVRLITNGLWPLVATPTAGWSCPTVSACGNDANSRPGMARPDRATPESTKQGISERGTKEMEQEQEEEEGFAASAAGRLYGGSAASVSSPSGTDDSIHGTEVDASAASVAREMAGIFDSVSVALNTADPGQYDELMNPSIEGRILAKGEAHSLVCDLVKECVDQGLSTECTVVDRGGVDVKRAEELVTALGASCRVRPYFP